MANGPPVRYRQLLDLLVYDGAITTIVLLVGLLVGLITGGGLVTAKFVLFVVGFVLLAIGTFKLRPRPPWKDESRIPSMDEQPLQIWLYDHWPLDSHGCRPPDRLPIGLKIMGAGVLVLVVSFVMESVFGVVR
ncbi:DUF7555 family protein [Halocatena halophila]|uniref:DUF7555 family protein n=1 Tax=Halocatena halophila TaxID=2814576 RepID=UPI002ED2CAF2